MRNILLLLIIPILPFVLTAQKSSSIDIVSNIDYGHRFINSEENVITTNFSESSNFNWSAGVNFSVKVTEGNHFKTGLRYGKLGYQTFPSDNDLRWPSDVKDGVYIPDPTNPNSFEWDYTYTFLEIPLIYRKELSQKKLTYYIEFGLLTKFNLSAEYERKFIFQEHIEIEAFNLTEANLFDVSLLASVGVNYSINDQFQLFGQPTFKYQLTSTESHGFNDNLFSVGMEFGLRRLLF